MGALLMSDRAVCDHRGRRRRGGGRARPDLFGHPVSAAVGWRCLKLYETACSRTGAATGARLMQGLDALRDHPLVGEVRGRGMLAAVELVTDKAAKTPLPAAAMPATRS